MGGRRRMPPRRYWEPPSQEGPMSEPHLRAADADRAAVADVLGRHMAAGRLTVAEYEERLTRAYAAKTYGELAELTTDLPGDAPVPPPASGATVATPGTSPA